MTQKSLLNKVRSHYPELVFVEHTDYLWSPKEKSVYYRRLDDSETGIWTLLHETSHGALAHNKYKSDFELVQLEVAAWVLAKELAEEFKIAIDEDHIQDCLDSYRDWHYKRSLCPDCDLGGIQIDSSNYQCIFCGGRWRVSSARFCRPYRRRRVL